MDRRRNLSWRGNFLDGIKNIRQKPEKFSPPLIIGRRFRSETTGSTSSGYVQFHVSHRVKVNLTRSGFKKNYCFALDPLPGQKLISNRVQRQLGKLRNIMRTTTTTVTTVPGVSTAFPLPFRYHPATLVRIFATATPPPPNNLRKPWEQLLNCPLD